MLSLQGTSLPVATVSMARPSRPQRVVLVLLACVPCVRSLVLPSVVPKLHEVQHRRRVGEARAAQGTATLTPAARAALRAQRTRPAVPSHTLHELATAGDASAIHVLLDAGLPCDLRNEKSSTPLHLAAAAGHAAVADDLLAHGANASATNAEGLTPLHAAVAKHNLRVARLLLSRGADVDVASKAGLRPARVAAQTGDAAMLAALVDAGAHIDEETADAAFWAAVAKIDSAPADAPLPAEVPRLLRTVFEADARQLLRRSDKIASNVTCMQPADEREHKWGGFELASLPLKRGRRCADGHCCDECSRVTLPSFASAAETNLDTFPGLDQFSLQKRAFRDTRDVLHFVRLLERARRAIAHEYGLPLPTVVPLQAGVSSRTTAVPLHCDESADADYHYSCVLYFRSQGDDFDGGTFLWSDRVTATATGRGAHGESIEANGAEWPLSGEDGRKTSALPPKRGTAIIFSSGWENLHEVEPVTWGTRIALPAFFTTSSAARGARTNAQTTPSLGSDEEARAAELRRLLLAPTRPDPSELMMKWHDLFAGP